MKTTYSQEGFALVCEDGSIIPYTFDGFIASTLQRHVNGEHLKTVAVIRTVTLELAPGCTIKNPEKL